MQQINESSEKCLIRHNKQYFKNIRHGQKTSLTKLVRLKRILQFSIPLLISGH